MKNIAFAGINYKWFIGQVPPNQTLDKTDPDGWGDRVKVRIVGMHNKSGSITPDEQLPWAIVERPTSQGNASRGSTGLTGGEWVRGYFLDPFDQVPVITAVLARGTYENNVSLEIVKTRKSTEFQNITRYNSFPAYSGQMRGGEKPTTPAQPTKQEFDGAKDSMADPQFKNVSESGVPKEPIITESPDGTKTVTIIDADGNKTNYTYKDRDIPASTLATFNKMQETAFNLQMSKEATLRGDDASATFYANRASGRG